MLIVVILWLSNDSLYPGQDICQCYYQLEGCLQYRENNLLFIYPGKIEYQLADSAPDYTKGLISCQFGSQADLLISLWGTTSESSDVIRSPRRRKARMS